MYDSRQIINERRYTTKELKTIFGLDINDYTRMVTNKEDGSKERKFDRTNFEKRVLIPAIEQINEGEMMQILTQPGKKGRVSYFGKTKTEQGSVCYIFRFKVKTRQSPVGWERQKEDQVIEMADEKEFVRDPEYMEEKKKEQAPEGSAYGRALKFLTENELEF